MKALLASVVLKFLGLGVLLLARRDERMRAELATFPVGQHLQIRAWDQGPVLRLTLGADGWSAASDGRPAGPDVVEVLFKSRRSALRALLGRQSVQQAFLENRLVVRGDVMVSLSLVRAVNLVEAHLFPAWWTKPLGPLPPRHLSFIATWTGALGVWWFPPQGARP